MFVSSIVVFCQCFDFFVLKNCENVDVFFDCADEESKIFEIFSFFEKNEADENK